MVEGTARPSTNLQYLVAQLELHWLYVSTRKYIWLHNLGMLIFWKWFPLQLQCIRCLIKIGTSVSYVSNSAIIVYKDKILNWEKPQHTTPRSGSWENGNFPVGFSATTESSSSLVFAWFLQENKLLSYSSSIPQQLVTVPPDIYRVHIVLKVLISKMASLLKV